MARAGRLALRALAGAAAGWALLVTGLLVERHGFIYPLAEGWSAAEVEGLPRGRPVRRAREGAPDLVAWVAPPEPGGRVLLHVTGNAGHLPSAARAVAPFVAAGHGAALLGYRGAGGAPGSPSEAALVTDAVALNDALAEILPGTAGPPVVWGTSLGAAVAVALTAERPAAALVLEAPFARLCSTVERRLPIVPACALMWDERWDSAARIASVRAPVLILAGGHDRVIPAAEARALFDAAPEPRRFRLDPGGGHDDLLARGGREAIAAFLAAHGLAAPRPLPAPVPGR